MVQTHEAFLLFIEPQGSPSKEPVIDIYTQKMTGALRAAKPGSAPYSKGIPEFDNSAWRGMHTCKCGAWGGNREYLVETAGGVFINDAGTPVQGLITNALCVHYVAFHRDEIHPIDLDRILLLNGEQADPTDAELRPPPNAKKQMANLMNALAEDVSRTPEAATEYLKAEGIDPQKVVSEGMRRIEEIKKKLKNES